MEKKTKRYLSNQNSTNIAFEIINFKTLNQKQIICVIRVCDFWKIFIHRDDKNIFTKKQTLSMMTIRHMVQYLSVHSFIIKITSKHFFVVKRSWVQVGRLMLSNICEDSQMDYFFKQSIPKKITLFRIITVQTCKC